MYDQYRQSGIINDFAESSELIESMELFKAVRRLGLAGSTTLKRVADVCGEYLFGLDHALRNKRISEKMLKSVCSKRELELIQQFLSEMDAVHNNREAEAQCYLEKRKGANGGQ